jgi:hypothetical protein
MAWKKYEPDAEIKGGAIDIYPTGTLRFNRTVWEELGSPEFITIHHDEEKGRLGYSSRTHHVPTPPSLADRQRRHACTSS